MWSKDFMHPEDPGMRVISDMVVNLVQQTALGLLLQPYSGMDKKVLQEPLAPPMHPGESAEGWVDPCSSVGGSDRCLIRCKCAKLWAVYACVLPIGGIP
jgi:hypothetical protein